MVFAEFRHLPVVAAYSHVFSSGMRASDPSNDLSETLGGLLLASLPLSGLAPIHHRSLTVRL